jgi:hypothetical protein
VSRAHDLDPAVLQYGSIGLIFGEMDDLAQDLVRVPAIVRGAGHSQ